MVKKMSCILRQNTSIYLGMPLKNQREPSGPPVVPNVFDVRESNFLNTPDGAQRGPIEPSRSPIRAAFYFFFENQSSPPPTI